MNEKDLKKLSRLELLELLLAESKENEMLKKSASAPQKFEISEVTIEPGSLKRIEKIANETNSAVMNIIKILTEIKENPEAMSPETKRDISVNQDYPIIPSKRKTSNNTGTSTDRQLFNRLMFYFAENAYLLDYFPKDIQQEIVSKIDEIFRNRNKQLI